MDININAPKLETLDVEIIKDRPTHIVPLTVSSHHTAEKEINEIINLYTKHGLLLRLRKIHHVSGEHLNYLDFNASTSATAWCDVLVCNPQTGSIIPNCKFITRMENELMFIHTAKDKKMPYIGIIIPANFISNEDLASLKIGDFVWIQCISVAPKLTGQTIYSSGRIHKMFDIPFELRYLGFFNNMTEIKNPFKLTLSKTGAPFLKELGYNEEKEKYINAMTDRLGDSWNNFYKHLFNPYELIKTRPVYLKMIDMPNEKPLREDAVSRAYFKIVEIVEAFDFKLIVSKDDLLVALADAPGGFSQAMRHMFPDNTVMTTSLNLPQEIVYDPIITQDKKIIVDFMETKTGDITDIRNIRYLHKTYKRKAAIVAADGAFDHTQYPDHDNEILHAQLLFSEIVAALGIQRTGGHACFKLYRRYTLVTVGIIYWTLQFYDSVIFYKPRSIRQANTESFVIFRGAKDVDSSLLKPALAQLEKMKPQKKYTEFIETLFEDGFIPQNFIRQIAKFNEYLDDVRVFSLECASVLHKARNINAGTIKAMTQRQAELKSKFIPRFE